MLWRWMLHLSPFMAWRGETARRSWSTPCTRGGSSLTETPEISEVCHMFYVNLFKSDWLEDPWLKSELENWNSGRPTTDQKMEVALIWNRGQTLIINNRVASSLWHRLAVVDPLSELLSKIQAVLVDFFGTTFTGCHRQGRTKGFGSRPCAPGRMGAVWT